MKKLSVIFYLLLSIVLLQSCKVSSRYIEILDDAESYMDERPDSALAVLRAMDPDMFPGRKAKAKYALLHSIALDKNYIDLTTDSIIAPAVEYYRRRGDVESRFKCHYYQARIHENSGDIDNALLCAAKAEALDTSKVSADMLCMLYGMKGTIYYDAWREKEAIEAGKLAGKYALEAGKYGHFVYYTMMMALMYRNIGDWQSVAESLTEVEDYAEYFTHRTVHLYNHIAIVQKLNSDTSPEDIVKYTEEYITSYPQYDMISWKTVARVYLNSGDLEKAMVMIDRHREFGDISNDPGYYAILSDILEADGNLIGALDAYKKYSEILGNKDLTLFRSDVALIEEKYQNELHNIRYSHLRIYISIIVIFILLVASYILHRWLKIRKDYGALRLGYEQLLRLNEGVIKETKLGALPYGDMRDILNKRLSAMAEFVHEPVPATLHKAKERVDELRQNRDAIVESIVLLYAVEFPDFILELRSCGLTLLETSICCLYLLGLNIPEAGDVIGRRSSIYNLNSVIREKLGNSKIDTKLDKWIVKYFTERYENGAY